MTANADPDQDAGDVDIFVQAALFSHFRVPDPDDWRTVILGLAARYAPDLLAGRAPVLRAVPAGKPGRPMKWDEDQLWTLLCCVEDLKRVSRLGLIRSDIETDKAACRFITGSAREAKWFQCLLGLKPGMRPTTLQNMLSQARRLFPGANPITEIPDEMP